MLFTVTDRKGRFVTDLTKDDFEVIESKKPQDHPGIQCGKRSAAAPRHPDRYQQQHPRALQVRAGGRQRVPATTASSTPTRTRAMVVSFDTSAELVSRPDRTTPRSWTQAIRGLRPGGGTALYDADLFRLPRQTVAGPAAAQVPPRDRDRERRRRQPEPLHARPGARNGAEGRRRALRHLHQHQQDRKRRRQGAEVLHRGDRRQGLLPLQSGRPGAVVREHRQRTAPPVQHLPTGPSR